MKDTSSAILSVMVCSPLGTHGVPDIDLPPPPRHPVAPHYFNAHTHHPFPLCSPYTSPWTFSFPVSQALSLCPSLLLYCANIPPHHAPPGSDEAKAYMVHHIVNGNMSYYQMLGLAPNASEEDIVKSYRQFALQLHPDKNADPQAGDAFSCLTHAFEVLSHSGSRALYDSSMPLGESSSIDSGPQSGRVGTPSSPLPHKHKQPPPCPISQLREYPFPEDCDASTERSRKPFPKHGSLASLRVQAEEWAKQQQRRAAAEEWHRRRLDRQREREEFQRRRHESAKRLDAFQPPPNVLRETIRRRRLQEQQRQANESKGRAEAALKTAQLDSQFERVQEQLQSLRKRVTGTSLDPVDLGNKTSARAPPSAERTTAS